jgi:hypothetical protein
MSVNRPQGRRLSLRMAAVLTLLLSATAVAQQNRAIGDWLTFGGDAACASQIFIRTENIAHSTSVL